MIDLNLFLNVFADSETQPSRFNPNLHEVPDTLVIQRLREICMRHELQYNWRVGQAGRFTTNGHAFFLGELTITQRDDGGNIVDEVTRLGSAEGETLEMGLSGMSTVAFKNAALRGFGMAEFLYEREVSAPPVANHLPAPDTARPYPQAGPNYQQQPTNFGPPNQPVRPFTPRTQGGGGYAPRGPQPQNNAPRAPQVPWDQERLTRSPGSGNYMGIPYANLDTAVLQKWVNGDTPNKYAVLELNYRANDSGFPNSPFAGTSGYGN